MRNPMNNSTKFALGLTFVGTLIGLLFSCAVYFGLKETSDAKFCALCHEMEPMILSYHQDVHGGAGRTGIQVDCVACHMPHESLLGYIFTKAKNGVVEGSIKFFYGTDHINWVENRANRDQFVFDSGCLECHREIIDPREGRETQAVRMHEHYKKLLNTPQKIACASCHTDTGHQSLRTILNYYKPEFEIYQDALQEDKERFMKSLRKPAPILP